MTEIKTVYSTEGVLRYEDGADIYFIDDDEKMIDFRTMSKDEFLRSYSYLTEEEYDNTAELAKEAI